MTARTVANSVLLAISCAFAAGCANDGALSTAAIAPDKPAATAAKVDPACVSLASQIDTLRQDGAADRLEKASTGKGAKVSVRRDTLAKQVELNKANADFQAKCAPSIPRAQTAQAAPAGTHTAAAAAQVAPVAAQTAGSTVKAQAQQAATAAATSAATDAVKAKAP